MDVGLDEFHTALRDCCTFAMEAAPVVHSTGARIRR